VYTITETEYRVRFRLLLYRIKTKMATYNRVLPGQQVTASQFSKHNLGITRNHGLQWIHISTTIFAQNIPPAYVICSRFSWSWCGILSYSSDNLGRLRCLSRWRKGPLSRDSEHIYYRTWVKVHTQNVLSQVENYEVMTIIIYDWQIFKKDERHVIQKVLNLY